MAIDQTIAILASGLRCRRIAIPMSDQEARSTRTSSRSRGCAIIVGAGTGTGAAVARLLSSEGHPVVLARRNPEQLSPLVREIEAVGGRALAVAADAANEAQVEVLFDQAQAAYGAPELVLFNAAGFLMRPLVETSIEDFEQMWRTSALGGFVVGQQAARRMLKSARGTILFAGATAAVKASPKFAAFASGKHGLRAVAESMAKELGPQGIHVAHLVIDGFIDVPRVHEAMPEVVATKGKDAMIDPSSVASTFLWLHRQPRDAWTFELDLRPYCERWRH